MKTPEEYEEMISHDNVFMSRGVIATMALASALNKLATVQALIAIKSDAALSSGERVKVLQKLCVLALGEEE